MPLQRCRVEGEPGWKYGAAGMCYTYTAGDEEGEVAAKKKAIQQAIAIGGGKPPAEGLADEGLGFLYRLADTVEAGKVVPMMLFPLGEWKSAKYPKLSLTAERAQRIIDNFEAGVLGTDVVVDSSGNHDTSAPAAGWIRSLYVAPYDHAGASGDALYADWEPTELGAELTNTGAYKYDSVEIGTHVDNATGKKTEDVLRSVTLTNTPVLRMLPALLEAADSIAASEAVSFALSELEAADTQEDPVAAICDQIDSLLGKLDETLKGKSGVRAMRTYLREVRSKAQPYKTTSAAEEEASGTDEQDGSSSHEVSQSHTERGDEMKKLVEHFKLTEDADEETLLAEVTKLEEQRDTAVTKLAEVEKAKREGEVTTILEAETKEGHILPADHDHLKKMAEVDYELFLEDIERAKARKVIALGEAGESKPEVKEYDDPSVELADKSQARSEKDGITFGEAMERVLAEDEALRNRVYPLPV